MTPQAIHRLTNIPQEIIDQGIAKLVAPDPQSRSRKLNGQRLELIDPDRSWGWRIVNYAYYRDLASAEDKRQKDKDRIAVKRKEIKSVAHVSQSVANVAHIDIDLDLDKDKRKIKDVRRNESAQLSDEQWIESLKSNPAYKDADVTNELHKMTAWCETNHKKPTRRRFLNWLNRIEKPLKRKEGSIYA